MSVFTTEEAAEYLRLKPKTLQKWRTEGKGPPYIEPERNMVRYREQDIIDWLSGTGPQKEQRSKMQELIHALDEATSVGQVLGLWYEARTSDDLPDADTVLAHAESRLEVKQ